MSDTTHWVERLQAKDEIIAGLTQQVEALTQSLEIAHDGNIRASKELCTLQQERDALRTMLRHTVTRRDCICQLCADIAQRVKEVPLEKVGVQP